MICSGHNDYVTWQLIKLHKQKGDYALDLAGLMLVCALFGDRVEFIEKKDTTASAGELEGVVKTSGSLA